MSTALSDHPRALELDAAARSQRWPYTRVLDWLNRSSPDTSSAARQPLAKPSAWIALEPGAHELADGSAYWLSAPAPDSAWAAQTWTLEVPAGAQVQLAACWQPSAEIQVLDSQIRLQLGADARLQLLRLQDGPSALTVFENWSLSLAERAQLQALEVLTGSSLSHLDLRIALQGEAAEAHWDSLALLQARARGVAHLRLEHAAEQTVSRLNVRNLLTDRARRSLIGTVAVERAGQHTDSAQICRSLLLSPGAGADMRPELEIYADQVQCAHGATCGELDEAAMHYLRSRGLDRETARGLLLESFALPQLAQASADLHAPLTDWVRHHLGQIGTGTVENP